MLRQVCLSVVVVLAALDALSAAEDQALEGREAVTTAKERLVNKAADPQRVDDCNVPLDKRDAGRERSSDCAHIKDDATVAGDGERR